MNVPCRISKTFNQNASVILHVLQGHSISFLIFVDGYYNIIVIYTTSTLLLVKRKQIIK